jgi:hypothetical protein
VIVNQPINLSQLSSQVGIAAMKQQVHLLNRHGIYSTRVVCQNDGGHGDGDGGDGNEQQRDGDEQQKQQQQQRGEWEKTAGSCLATLDQRLGRLYR